MPRDARRLVLRMSGFELRLTIPGAAAPPGSTAPDRVTPWSCIGCGARGMPDVCTGACDDWPVEYVRAIDLDAVLAAAQSLTDLAAALRDLAADVAGAAPGGDEWERKWRVWQDRARAVCAAWPETSRLPEPAAAERIAGWWCGACGRIESPQPCLGSARAGTTNGFSPTATTRRGRTPRTPPTPSRSCAFSPPSSPTRPRGPASGSAPGARCRTARRLLRA